MRKYNTLTVTGSTAIRIPIIKRAVVDFAVGADWTPGAGDVKINVDGAGPTNVTNLPTAIASGNGAYWEFILTAAELTCKQAIVTIVDAATKAIEDQCFLVETFGNASAMYQADLSAANLPANVTQLLGTAWLTPGTAGTPDINVKTINAISTAPVTTVKAVQGLTTADVIASVSGAVGSVTGAVGSVTTNNDKTGYTLSNTGMDNLLDRSAGVETNFTLRQALRLILSACVGKLSGAATATVSIRDVNDTKDRVTATVDASGNRSAVTTDVT